MRVKESLCRATDSGHSGCCPVIPVIPGRGGSEPGQIRDNRHDPIDSGQWPANRDGEDDPPRRLPPLPAERQSRERSRRRRSKGDKSPGRSAVERQADLARTASEVVDIAAAAHAELSRDQAKSIGAIYARYSSRHQDSVADQVRALYEVAIRERIFVPLEFVFYDLGIRGCKRERVGLNRLMAVVECGKIGTRSRPGEQ